MYSNDQACVKVGDKLTDPFLTNQGVKQGCILSPILFNIFLADLSNSLKDDPLKLSEDVGIKSIIWADDLLLLSESENGLNKKLENLYNYCIENGTVLNQDKTKCMVFNKTGKHIRKSFTFGNIKLDTTREYRYLGFLITPSLNINTILTDLKDRALRSFYAMKGKMGIHFRQDIGVTLHLFDTLVKPILLYGSDFWGCLKLPKNNPIENVHMRFCKDLLGVQKQTPNLGVLLELGRISITIFAKKNCVKNWERIAISKNANSLIKAGYNSDARNNVGWANTMKNYLSGIGLLDIFLNINRANRKPPHIETFIREKDIFYQTIFFTLQNESAKLKTYAKLKNYIGMEHYLNSVSTIEHRISMTKLRLSNHKLMIEKGRHNNIESHKRFCPFCPNCIENECHFLLTCPAYSTGRLNLLNHIHIGDNPIRNENLFINLLTEKHWVNDTAEFIWNANHIRDFLLERHKHFI